MEAARLALWLNDQMSLGNAKHQGRDGFGPAPIPVLTTAEPWTLDRTTTSSPRVQGVVGRRGPGEGQIPRGVGGPTNAVSEGG